MEKEFIPYEQALALKELGFDEECFSYVKHLGYDSSKEKVRVLSEVSRSQIEDMGLPLLKIPTFSQAFRWFREKYNGVCEITRKEDGNHSEFSGWIFIDNKRINIISYWDSKTYEEVELECLKKLIEIVKRK